MARQNNYSYSWFKKRTAYINKMLKTSAAERYYKSGKKKGQKIVLFSPAAEYRAYQKKAAVGETTLFVERYGGDPRSESGVYSLNVALKEKTLYRWDNFLKSNRRAALLASVLNEKDYVIQPNTLKVYKIIKGDRGGSHYYEVFPNGNVARTESRVSNVVQPNAANVNAAIAKKAAEIRKEKDRHDVFWRYDDE